MSEPRVVTDRSTVREVAADAEPADRIPVEVRVTVADPFEAYRRARSGSGGCCIETSGGSGWSYFGVEPIEWLTVGPDGDAIDTLVDRLAEERLLRGDCEVPYPCGAVGWLSYDAVRAIEDLPADAERDRGLPRLQVGVYDTLVAWQEPAEAPVELRVTACPRVGDRDPDTVFERGREQACSLARELLDGDPSVTATPADGPVHFRSDCGRSAFTDRVETVKQYIHDGDTFQTNVSHRLRAPAAVHPVAVFAALRETNPAPYSGLLEFPDADLVSASPELLLQRDGPELLTEPIAGTRPRGETADADRRLEADLRADEKERAEHAMLVDLERNDLGKVSTFGSVDVREYRRVDRYSEVMHLVSLVEGRLRDDRDLADAIRAVFPGGTITGAPKPRTMEIIDEVEATRRGPYTGSIGIFGFDDRATLNIVIRTLVRYDEEYHLRVGAGIVHDSVPDQEYDETLDKARALVTAVGDALGRDVGVIGADPTSTDRGADP